MRRLVAYRDDTSTHLTDSPVEKKSDILEQTLLLSFPALSKACFTSQYKPTHFDLPRQAFLRLVGMICKLKGPAEKGD